MLIVKPSLSSLYYSLIFNIALGKQIHLELTLSAFELPNLKTIGFNPKCSRIPCNECTLFKPRPFGNTDELCKVCGIIYSVRRMLNVFPLKK